MTQVTEVDFEVQEKEVNRYKCDECGSVVDEEHINTQTLYEGVNLSRSNVEESGHICDTCAESERYLTLVQMADLKQSVGNAIGKTFSYGVKGFWVIFSGIVGIGLGTMYSLVRIGPRTMGDASVLTAGDGLVILFLGIILSFFYLTFAAGVFSIIFDKEI